jgi:uncharacterized protein YndB with AHSA1/START domain
MWSNAVSLDLPVPPERVYAYLVDFTRHADWSSNVKVIQLTAGETGTVGGEYEATEDVPRPMSTYARITALEPPKRIAWEATDKRVFRTAWRFDIEPRGDGSRLTQSVEFYPLNLFANVILYLFRTPRVEQENRASLERIRERLESGSNR